jgi:hypothetical protein
MLYALTANSPMAKLFKIIKGLSLSPLLHLFDGIKERLFFKSSNNTELNLKQYALYSVAKQYFTLNIPFQWVCCAISAIVREISCNIFLLKLNMNRYGVKVKVKWT